MSKKILVVDDDQQIQIIIKYILEKQGYKVRTADNGSEALDIIHVHHCDLVLLDIQMPIMNGFETLVEIRNSPSTEKLHVLILSSNQSTSDILKAADYGIDGYILKPPRKNEIVRRVKKVFERK